IGCLLPADGIRLYMARVDPHLTFGCEVCLDTEADNLGKPMHARHKLKFIRRLLGLHDHSILALLFTEAGIFSLTY
ncbi:hypothetical protein C8J57DRAFT_1047082, partial [Mycena rebaudengoi]